MHCSLKMSGPLSGAKPSPMRMSKQPQPAAFFTSATICCSTTGVISAIAYAVGHIGPSSRAARSLNPSVEYLVSNLAPAWKNSTILPAPLA